MIKPIVDGHGGETTCFVFSGDQYAVGEERRRVKQTFWYRPYLRYVFSLKKTFCLKKAFVVRENISSMLLFHLTVLLCVFPDHGDK